MSERNQAGQRGVVKKKLDVCGVVDEDPTIYENITKMDKKMSYKDAIVIVDALKKHLFFSNLTEDQIGISLPLLN